MMSEVLYHTTWTRLVPRIRRQGLRLCQPSNWESRDGKQKHYGGGAIFAFSDYEDAVRWAGKMEWDHIQKLGTGCISIVVFRRDGQWDSDFADTLTRAMYQGEWLKTFAPIPAAAIVSADAVTTKQIRALIAGTKLRSA